MGRDKACLEVAGRPLFRHTLDLLCRYFDRVLIAGDRPDLALAEVPSIPDIYPGSALGGIYTGLRAAESEWIFVAPCDMPFAEPRILELLLEMSSGADAVVPRTPDGYEPVFALYHRNCLPHVERMLRAGRLRILDFYREINVRFLDWQQMPEGWQRSLLNINTPEQLAELRMEQR